ncbi:XopV/AopV family type III secretion system effector [Ralstonia solanacearum]|uniref:XopV/AopV family type III secretion system effector n=1 Tax=Ralstonia solanacearum TaxID=305 RepID=UPI001E46DCA7|nr:XopV/AopV family type III secretion system effector [Ralstonia solanacearum]
MARETKRPSGPEPPADRLPGLMIGPDVGASGNEVGMLKVGRISLSLGWAQASHGDGSAGTSSPAESGDAPKGRSRAPAFSGLKPSAGATEATEPSLRRATSVKLPEPDRTEPRRLERTLSGTGSLERTPFRLDPAKYLNQHGKTLAEKYGSRQPARGKSKKSPIQRDEREKLPHGGWRTRVNPTRILVKSKSIKTQADIGCVDLAKGAPAASRSLSELIDVARLVREPGVFKYKWDMSVNGTLIIGNIHVPKPDGDGVHQLGHPTLVGGARRIPEARISGTLYADKAGNLIIDNDSGRFSEYEDRSKEQLDEVAALFRKNKLPVQANWVDMQNKSKPRPPIKLVNRSDWCGLPDDAKAKTATPASST